MKIFDIIILLFFIVIIFKQLLYIKTLIIPTKKSYLEIATVLLVIIALGSIIYFFAKSWIHYITGILAIVMLLLMWIKRGISSKGFLSMYKYKEVILWSEIEKVSVIIRSKDIKVKVLGSFMEQTFYFKNCDFDKVNITLKENLDIKTYLKIVNEK